MIRVDEKTKINLRVGLKIRDIFEGEAAVEDVRIGTLANRVLREELEKVLSIGSNNCLIIGSRDYEKSQSKIQENRSNYYLFPTIKTTSSFIATQLDNKNYPQISFYFTPKEIEVMQELVRKQRIPYTIRDDGSIKSYRYVVAGMLLNNPLFDELGARVN